MTSPTIETRRDRRRGCGWRKPGGLYLVAEGPAAECGRLPIPLDVCPTCGGGIKPARGWTWVNGTALATTRGCDNAPMCATCPLGRPIGRCGLLWVGGRFYRRPSHWVQEAIRQGVCRRIPAIPRDLELGKTWVLLAHRKVIANLDGSWTPAVFGIFRPRAIEYVVRGDESGEELQRLAARGATPVRVERVEDPPPLAVEAAQGCAHADTT